MEDFTSVIFIFSYLIIGFVGTFVSIGFFEIPIDNNSKDENFILFCIFAWPLAIFLIVLFITGKFLIEIGESLSNKT